MEGCADADGGAMDNDEDEVEDGARVGGRGKDRLISSATGT
jgi:hypothetical protein